MQPKKSAAPDTRTVQVPLNGMPQGSSPMLSVQLNDDEEVVWLWTHTANGGSFVSGYEIVKKSVTPGAAH